MTLSHLLASAPWPPAQVPSRAGGRKQGKEAQVGQLRTELEALQMLRPLQGVGVPMLVAYG